MLHSSTAAQLVVNAATCMGLTDGGGWWQAEIFVEASSTLVEKGQDRGYKFKWANYVERRRILSKSFTRLSEGSISVSLIG